MGLDICLHKPAVHRRHDAEWQAKRAKKRTAAQRKKQRTESSSHSLPNKQITDEYRKNHPNGRDSKGNSGSKGSDQRQGGSKNKGNDKGSKNDGSKKDGSKDKDNDKNNGKNNGKDDGKDKDKDDDKDDDKDKTDDNDDDDDNDNEDEDDNKNDNDNDNDDDNDNERDDENDKDGNDRGHNHDHNHDDPKKGIGAPPKGDPGKTVKPGPGQNKDGNKPNRDSPGSKGGDKTKGSEGKKDSSKPNEMKEPRPGHTPSGPPLRPQSPPDTSTATPSLLFNDDRSGTAAPTPAPGDPLYDSIPPISDGSKSITTPSTGPNGPTPTKPKDGSDFGTKVLTYTLIPLALLAVAVAAAYAYRRRRARRYRQRMRDAETALAAMAATRGAGDTDGSDNDGASILSVESFRPPPPHPSEVDITTESMERNELINNSMGEGSSGSNSRGNLHGEGRVGARTEILVDGHEVGPHVIGAPKRDESHSDDYQDYSHVCQRQMLGLPCTNHSISCFVAMNNGDGGLRAKSPNVQRNPPSSLE
ncbi:hypothetical protein BGZ73_009105 [Actinomortierella ambigua]|nr:hypothetical protein BGZ73_009105 [Actinomortierella ambigua]